MTSTFNKMPPVIYRVTRSYMDFIKLNDEIRKLFNLNTNLVSYSSGFVKTPAESFERYLQEIASYENSKTSAIFAEFLISMEFMQMTNPLTAKRSKSIMIEMPIYNAVDDQEKVNRDYGY